MSTRATNLNAWDRQPGESQQAFSAFSIWLRLPTRSVIEAYRVYSGQQTARSRPGFFGKWASRWRWNERGIAYDAEITRQAHAQEVERVLAERELWQARRQQVCEAEWQYADKLIQKAQEMLDFPVAEQRVTETSELQDGRTLIQHVTIKPGPWRSRDAGYMLALATKMRRMAADMATDRIETVEPINPHQAKLMEAAKTLADVRQMEHGLDEAVLVERVAAAFNFTADEVLTAEAELAEMTTSPLVN